MAGREEMTPMNKKMYLEHIYLDLPIHLSASLAFKTSALLTLIACCHIFIPQKALEKPLPERSKQIRIGFCLPWPLREVRLPATRSE